MIRTVGNLDLAEGIPPGHYNHVGLLLRLTQETGDVLLGVRGALPVLHWLTRSLVDHFSTMGR
jgi:hypothetical protein